MKVVKVIRTIIYKIIKFIVKYPFNLVGLDISRYHKNLPEDIKSHKNVVNAPFTEESKQNPKIQPNSLLKYSKNTYSQAGQDGIIEFIFDQLEKAKGFFVEFGACDGIRDSNCRKLFEKGWGGVFIEPSNNEFELLRENYKNHDNVICINEWVTHDSNDQVGSTFDAIADKYFPDKHIDFLSIDIDGLDYNVYKSIKRRPTVVCVEGGGSWHPKFTKKIPDSVAAHNLQQPLSVIIKLGKSKGYEPLCFNQDTFFIIKENFSQFKGLIKNDAVTMWYDFWHWLTDDEKRILLQFRENTWPIRIIEGDEYREI